MTKRTVHFGHNRSTRNRKNLQKLECRLLKITSMTMKKTSKSSILSIENSIGNFAKYFSNFWKSNCDYRNENPVEGAESDGSIEVGGDVPPRTRLGVILREIQLISIFLRRHHFTTSIESRKLKFSHFMQ